MQSEGRNLRTRKPLSDCTNKLTSSQNPTNPNVAFTYLKNPLTNFDNAIVNCTPNYNNNNKYAQNQNRSSVTPRRSGSVNDICSSDLFEPQTVYARRCSADNRSKGNEVEKRVWSAREQKDADGDLSESKFRRVVAQGKKTKDASLKQDASIDSLDAYIKRQRVYFEAIDAEKLEEEVA